MTPISIGMPDPQDDIAAYGVAAVVDGGFTFDVDSSSFKPGRYHVEAWASGMTDASILYFMAQPDSDDECPLMFRQSCHARDSGFEFRSGSSNCRDR
jgi:hypothetical protein